MEFTNGIYKLEELQLVIVRELIQLFFGIYAILVLTL